MRSNHVLRTLLVIAITFAVPALAHAGGDAAAGKAKAQACLACHVPDATTGDIPRLVGQREGYLAKQLKAFKAGSRKNPVMNALTTVLSEGDIANIAAFWAGQPSGSDATVPAEIAAIKKPKMSFPRDFPKGFVQYSTVNSDDQATVVKQYINSLGFDAIKAGKPLPEGSILVVVKYAAKLDADKKPIADKDGHWETDKIKAYEAMEMRTGWGKDIPELIRNGDWSYASFSADKTPQPEFNQAICLACHIPAASKQFVFGLAKVQAKAGAK